MARPEDGRVNDIGMVSSSNDKDILVRAHSVHLVTNQQHHLGYESMTALDMAFLTNDYDDPLIHIQFIRVAELHYNMNP